MNTTVSGAYGRDYKSIHAMLKDWEGGKDFIVHPSGQYCSTRDFPPGTIISMRYNNKRDQYIHTQK